MIKRQTCFHFTFGVMAIKRSTLTQINTKPSQPLQKTKKQKQFHVSPPSPDAVT